MPTNDNDLPSGEPTLRSSEAHGRAALLLVESLIHGLCQSSALSAAQAVEIAERAVDVQAEQVEEADNAPISLRQSHALLTSITLSLRIDMRGGDGGLR